MNLENGNVLSVTILPGIIDLLLRRQVKLVQLHYHDHTDTCKQCLKAAESVDPFLVMMESQKALQEIYDNSCEVGKQILEQFWMTYKNESD